jgi:uncharacterized protein (TIGR04255 family)
MTLHLPEPNDVTLDRSPLEFVVCQVRHERILAVSDPRRGLAVHDRLAEAYPQMEQRPSMQAVMLLGQGRAPAMSHEQGPVGWTLRSEDGDWTVTLDPEFFSVETSAYVSWSDFEGRLSTLCEAVNDAYEPTLETRLGLRYVDQVKDPAVAEPAGWRGWIRDEMLGPLVIEGFAPAIRGIEQQVEFDAGGGYRVVLRHGTSLDQSPSTWAYLLDHDCFRQSARPFTVSGVLEAASDLHRLALQVFQSVITPKLYDYLLTGKVEHADN